MRCADAPRRGKFERSFRDGHGLAVKCAGHRPALFLLSFPPSARRENEVTDSWVFGFVLLGSDFAFGRFRALTTQSCATCLSSKLRTRRKKGNPASVSVGCGMSTARALGCSSTDKRRCLSASSSYIFRQRGVSMRSKLQPTITQAIFNPAFRRYS
jgi:hypothetical protein